MQCEHPSHSQPRRAVGAAALLVLPLVGAHTPAQKNIFARDLFGPREGERWTQSGQAKDDERRKDKGREQSIEQLCATNEQPASQPAGEAAS